VLGGGRLGPALEELDDPRDRDLRRRPPDDEADVPGVEAQLVALLEPTRPASGRATGSGTMWSRSAMTVSIGTVMSLRETCSPSRRSASQTKAFSRTSSSMVCRAAAPGNGTWSLAQPVIAW
jgi:hypothetical protein